MDLPVRPGPPGPDVLPEVREVRLTSSAELADQSLREARVRERFGVLVLAVRRADGTSEVTPSPETRLRPGDLLRVFGLPAQLAAFEAATADSADAPSARRKQRETLQGRPEIPSNGSGTTLRAPVQLWVVFAPDKGGPPKLS